jgi:SAM-dependent methyltransferase
VGPIGAVIVGYRQTLLVASFESVADEYDSARPSYPMGVYEALGDISGLTVLDVGAGTGIATRQLTERGARVVAVDPGRAVLGKAVSHTPGLPAVVADGAVLPVRDEATDLVCFAQSWHWLDEATRVDEVSRVLRPGGRWAGWWSHARADDQAWFGEYWSTIELACRGAHRDQRNMDWGATIDVPEMFDVADCQRSVRSARRRSAEPRAGGQVNRAVVANRTARFTRVRPVASPPCRRSPG